MLLMHQYTYQMRKEEEEETWVLKMERRTEEEEDNCSATLDLHLKFLEGFTHHNYINVNEGLLVFSKICVGCLPLILKSHVRLP
ncbi:hypothetical protein Tco_0202962, partial [Tanacetum coccineum]